MGFFMRLLLLCMVLLCLNNVITVANHVPTLQPSCLDHERLALLHFKHSFRKDCTTSRYPSPKMDSWIGGANQDCCSWDGVRCDMTTGHVIGLDLSSGCIRGTFPPNSSLFSLTHLQHLNLSVNDFSLSPIPSEIHLLHNLKSLVLRNSSFCCQIPFGLSKLSNLSFLDISHNYLSGPIPSLGNLTTITTLWFEKPDINGNFVPGKLSSWLPKLHNLESLILSKVELPSEMPRLLANFTKLKELALFETQLTGLFPQELANLTQLQTLYLRNNKLEGPIPHWVSQQLTNLHALVLSNNNLFCNFDIFFNLKGLHRLELSGVKLSFSPHSRNNISLFKLHELDLSSCNLTKFPSFLHNQDELQYLNLSGNNITGNIPQWFLDITKDSLVDLSLTKNFLTGFELPLVVLPWTRLKMLDIGDNKFQGELPSLPDSLKFCNFSNNLLTGLNPTLFCNTRTLVYLDLSFNSMSGEIPNCRGHRFVGSLQILNLHKNNLGGVIPKEICHARSLISIDLSSNNISGHIPSCMGNQLGNSLQFLNLQNNSFIGTIPPTFTRLCKLHLINLSQNKLHGQLPRSLANCSMLEVLDIRNNHVNDTFPSWLGSLPTLQVLILGHNKFHGSIGDPISDLDFRFLRIMDLSQNQHIGNLPYRYIQNMHAMRDSKEDNPGPYNIRYKNGMDLGVITYYPSQLYCITITNKGNEIPYAKIPKVLRFIDFSGNYFTGRIPDMIGDLKGLRVLNLSSNNLYGEIPSSLANITDLESLDLSLNKLTGSIPQGLSQLTFLEVFKVSYNNLMGPIPQGNQFGTFDNTSYEGNQGLCGSPLSKKCKNADSSWTLPLEPSDEGNEDSEFIDWVIRSLGCLSGCVVGFIIGKLFITDKYHEWFIDTFGRQRMQRRVQRAQRHRL